MGHPGVNAPSKKNARVQVAKALKIADPESVIILNMSTVFGGGKSKFLALAYENKAAAMKYDKNYRLLRMGITQEFKTPKKARRARKDLVTAASKVRGAAKTKLMAIRQKK